MIDSEQIRQRKEKARNYRKTLWGEIKPPLVQAGVGEIVMVYDGGGDEGVSEVIRFHSAQTEKPAFGEEPRAITVSEDLRDEITNLLFDCLYFEFTGWEEGDGSWGQVSLDVSSGEVLIDHNWRTSEEDVATVHLEDEGEETEMNGKETAANGRDQEQ